jgi:hypothetical protein
MFKGGRSVASSWCRVRSCTTPPHPCPGATPHHVSPRWIGIREFVVNPILTRPATIPNTVISNSDGSPPSPSTTNVCSFFRVSTSIGHHLSVGHGWETKKAGSQTDPLFRACFRAGLRCDEPFGPGRFARRLVLRRCSAGNPVEQRRTATAPKSGRPHSSTLTVSPNRSECNQRFGRGDTFAM